jgi:hypothetical protein
MANQTEILTAELNAINFWDRMYVDNPEPDQIDKDACVARLFRRSQVIVELERIARSNGETRFRKPEKLIPPQK